MAHEILEVVCLVRANQTWITQYIPWKLDSPRGDQFSAEFSRFLQKNHSKSLLFCERSVPMQVKEAEKLALVHEA